MSIDIESDFQEILTRAIAHNAITTQIDQMSVIIDRVLHVTCTLPLSEALRTQFSRQLLNALARKQHDSRD